MASDRVAHPTDDEEDQKRKYVLSEPFNTLSLGQVTNTTPSGQTAPPAPSDTLPLSALSEYGLHREVLCANRQTSLDFQDLLLLLLLRIWLFTPPACVYYKQLGMTPSQSGLLVGIRYFIEFCSAPFWGVVADATRKGRWFCCFLYSAGWVFKLRVSASSSQQLWPVSVRTLLLRHQPTLQTIRKLLTIPDKDDS